MNAKWFVLSKTNAVAAIGAAASIVALLVPYQDQIERALGPHYGPILGLAFSVIVALARNIGSNTTLTKPDGTP